MGRLRRCLLCLGFGLALALFAADARATIYCNFPWSAQSYWSINPGEGLAFSFEARVSGNAGQVGAAMNGFDTLESIPVTYRLTDSLTSPTFVENMAAFVPAGVDIAYTFSLSSPLFIEDSTYFFAVINDSDSPIGWQKTATFDTGSPFVSGDGGSTWSAGTDQVAKGAFCVDNDMIPEPSSMVLMTGLLPLGVVLLVRRRKMENATAEGRITRA